MSGEKTEEPTSKRLRDLREKGDVPQSKEVVSAALIVAFFALFAVSLPKLVDQLGALILLPVPLLNTDLGNSAGQLIHAYVGALQRLLVPFILVLLVVGIGACVLQNGLLLSPNGVTPQLNRISPQQYVKKTFALQNLLEFGKSVIKVLILTLILLIVLRDGMQALVYLPNCGISCMRDLTGEMLREIAIYTALVFIVVGAADFAFQRWNYKKKNMMSKDEVKREYKESEGDPLIKGKRKQLHQQLMTDGMADTAAKATVLITNPTHIAAAIYYNRETTLLPIMSAIGTDLVARRMKEVAITAGVPLVENVPLAHALLDDGIINQYIPSHLIEILAEILRTVEDLKLEAGGPAT